MSGIATPESEVIERKGLRLAVRANQAVWLCVGYGATGKEGGDNYNEQCLFHIGVLRFIAFRLFYPNRVALCNIFLSRVVI